MGVAPSTLIPAIEGMISTMPTNAPQSVGEWIKDVKSLLRLTSLRDRTDWAFQASADVDESANVIIAAAATVYAVLVGTNSADAEADWFVITNATSNTFDGTAALDNTDFVAFALPIAGTDGTEEFHGMVFPQGLPCGTGISLGADGMDGTNPAADDIRAWILYREA